MNSLVTRVLNLSVQRASLFVFVFFSAAVLAASEAIVDPPLHPTVLMAEYKKAFLPIIGADGQDPQVEYEGKLKRLGASSRSYTPLRGETFAPGMIQLKKLQAGSRKTNLVYMFSGGGEVSGGTIDAHSDFEATIVSTEARTHCYVAVLFFDPAFSKGETDKPSAAVVFQDIPDLVAGKETKVSIRFGYMDNENERRTYFPLFFSRGIEIRTPLSDQSAVFFRRIELLTHEKLVKNYRDKNAGKSHKVEPYLQVPVVIPPDYPRDKLPATVSTSFMVSDEGRVESLEIEERLPPQINRAVRRAVGGWLFFPRLQDGHPVRTLVKLPIGFGEAKAAAGESKASEK